MLREAIDLLLAQSEAQAAVWLLLENNPSVPGPVLGVFSSPVLTMEAPRVHVKLRLPLPEMSFSQGQEK
jgi:hypothetical protein